MEMKIMPQRIAEEISKDLDVKTSIISIVGRTEDDAVFSDNKNIDKIFRMRFPDCVTDMKFKGGILKAPMQEDFVGLKEFVDSLSCDMLIVHCGAGYSRSAAVAAAINDYLNLGYEIFGNPNYCPNPTVYKCCQNELGIAKTKDFYENLFANQEKEEMCDIVLDNSEER